MSRLTRTIAGAAGCALWLATGAQAQTPAPPASPSAAMPPASAGDKPADGGYATEQTYKMKEGGMYQPPAERPASPAQDYKVENRT